MRTPLGTPWGPLGTLGPPWGSLRDRWGSLGQPLVSQESPKSAPRMPQERLRALKSAPRESNKRPKRARKRSEGAPRGLPRRREELLEDPKGSQGVPQSTKIRFQSASHGQSLTAYDFLSHETEICTISMLCQISEPCKNIIFLFFELFLMCLLRRKFCEHTQPNLSQTIKNHFQKVKNP